MRKGTRERYVDWSNSWFQNFVFLLLGSLIGWGVSAYYAREADKDTQRQERMLTTLLLTAEQQGVVKLARDAKGGITGGRVIELRGAVQESQDSTSASGSLSAGAPAAHR
jgi:hypothetical protein